MARQTQRILVVAALGLLLGACGMEAGQPEQDRRGALGKADLAGSCKGFCGTQSADGCWCDDQCQLFGDCCVDRDQQCNTSPTPIFCGGIAGLPCPMGYRCQLDGDYPDAGGKCVQCPQVMCMLYCEHGFEVDENGCDICTCKQPACPPVMCMLYCEHGFEVDENGCDICKCKQPERNVATGACIKNSFDSCNSDADCVGGGCGGELCYNPAFGGGISTCECVQPSGVSCGCVSGKCAWWN